MIDAINRVIVHDTIMHYGENECLNVCMEEPAELIQAISKLKRFKHTSMQSMYLDNLKEEIADVLIIIEELMLIYDIEESGRRVEKVRDLISKQKLLEELNYKGFMNFVMLANSGTSDDEVYDKVQAYMRDIVEIIEHQPILHHVGTFKIRDNENGTVRDYGTNHHDSLSISMNGGCLTYKNLQNGDGSMEDGRGGYSFVLDDGKTPEESDSAEAINGCCYANIGGF